MASASFICKRCTGAVRDIDIASCNGDGLTSAGVGGFDLGDGVVLEKVEKFCYLGDMLSKEGGAELVVVTRIRGAWKKFRELAPIVTSKGASLVVKERVYASNVRSCMMYGSETWPLKKEQEAKLERTEMMMVRWMSGVSLRER